MLGKRKKQILDFVNHYTNKNGFAPSLEEIKKKTGLSSVSTVHHHLKDLEEHGYLKRHEGKPRSIETRDLTVTIPLRGYIAAGQPIEAVQEKEIIAIPKDKLPRSGKVYALRVSGDSMIEENINDGD